MNEVPHITIDKPTIEEFCRRHHIKRLSFFGSVLREDFKPESDIDILVEFEAGAKVTLFDMGGMQIELSEILGRTVDLKTTGYLSRYFRQEVEDTAQVIYEQA